MPAARETGLKILADAIKSGEWADLYTEAMKAVFPVHCDAGNSKLQHFHGPELLARKAGLSVRSVKRANAELVQIGRIKRTHDGNPGHASITTLIPVTAKPRNWRKACDVTSDTSVSVTGGVVTETPGGSVTSDMGGSVTSDTTTIPPQPLGGGGGIERVGGGGVETPAVASVPRPQRTPKEEGEIRIALTTAFKRIGVWQGKQANEIIEELLNYVGSADDFADAIDIGIDEMQADQSIRSIPAVAIPRTRMRFADWLTEAKRRDAEYIAAHPGDY
jgi:hypothetical protein